MTNSNQRVGNPKNYQLTEADFRQINIRNLFFNQLGWNYERMQGSGYLWIILPQLRKMYGDNSPELQKMMVMHSQFFNTSPFFNTIVKGIDLALEEKQGEKSIEAVAGIKSGLMGPFAAIGDAIFGSLVPAIMGAIAATMAMNGNPLGVGLWVMVAIATMIFRWVQLKIAYREGVNLVTHLGHKLNALTNAATVLGVFVVGVMCAMMVNVTVPFTATIGEKVVSAQANLDLILPRLVPALVVAFIYWLIGRPKMNSNKAIMIIIALCILLSWAGLLAKG
ncbi:PTS fructose transporter subunit IID [[Actinobacillus] muris]|uniref:PTS fructose transporter subunit IID n=1 Tax=Muribacter muris TaxID=67855 RepID=A0A0J5P6F5_9PAST|nr:PTS system mannose/fructose/sorbose family transporter subunit IID [Muribacter muris]KMK51826.1 PTS fructose transporter subunit IID [[Actinobacillus] muris] [Muribacter muris]MBF0785838.1 PTS system mannose/fructose/sorbose family transporter subunit IID [Muribacter muris]MBF0827095.1 PTS system mannose/fructose/sorbose family transporter subunit IID [Muribacter muris]TFV08537.1 PTS system mannose/fructose/sorbose family transporter subunit IID [Muribacter muris]